MTGIDFEQLLIDASNLASKTMLDAKNSKDFYVDKKSDSKCAESSVLTYADEKTEEALIRFFAERLPEYNFIGEESGNKNIDISKMIVADPIDCTLGFTKFDSKKVGHPENSENFGTIIGIYENGINVAGSESLAVKGTIYVATLGKGLRRIGPDDEASSNTIYLERPDNLIDVFGKEKGDLLNERITRAFKEAFPGVNFIIHKPHVLNKCRVFSDKYLGVFHATWSRHDLAAAPIMSKTTGSYLSDHNGERFEPVDFLEEFKKYATKSNVVIYSLPTVIAKSKEVYEKMLKVLSEFKHELDAVRNPEY